MQKIKLHNWIYCFAVIVFHFAVLIGFEWNSLFLGNGYNREPVNLAIIIFSLCIALLNIRFFNIIRILVAIFNLIYALSSFSILTPLDESNAPLEWKYQFITTLCVVATLMLIAVIIEIIYRKKNKFQVA
ncbi:MAG: hypothetical protein IJV56_00630 [Neisseriaceae bacterium]|nr:hypothetical protein [Neisseriaceae bacterium]